MSDIIQLLPDHVANQIAAGEVVQRPASVVKELLENAIDAEATEIRLIIKEAGKTLIQVVDNGKGMSVTDARLCFERHATSKIKTAADLFNLSTKGFRGEAMASIAAIAHVEMRTKPHEDDLGTHIKIAGSEVLYQEPCATPSGTSIEVKNLFFNVPARRNFLKSSAVELRHIIDEFHRVAMVHSSIKFEFYSNGSELFKLPTSNVRQRLVHIFGGKTNEKLVPVSETTDILTIKGFVGKPEFSKKTKGEQFFFVNDRFIKSPYLHHAIMSAFEGLLPPKNQPSYYLYLQVDPKSIDINIHPTKTEVKFDNEHALYAMVKATVKHGLGQFNIAPVLDFDRETSMDVPYEYKDKPIANPQVSVDRNFNPFAAESYPNEASNGNLNALASRFNSATNSDSNFSSNSISKPSSRSNSNSSSGSSSFVSNFQSKINKSNQPSWESLYSGLQIDTTDNLEVTSKFELESEVNNPALFEQSELASRNVYQLQRKYLVSTIKSGLIVVHHNRAHQRILYENFRKQISHAAVTSQQLLFPLQLTFTKIELEILSNLQSELESVGFVFQNDKVETLSITGIPTVVNESEVEGVLEQLIAEVQLDIPKDNFSQMEILSKSLAKSAAVKTGALIETSMQQHLIDQLFACETPDLCPNGKKTFVTIRMEELDIKF